MLTSSLLRFEVDAVGVHIVLRQKEGVGVEGVTTATPSKDRRTRVLSCRRIDSRDAVRGCFRDPLIEGATAVGLSSASRMLRPIVERDFAPPFARKDAFTAAFLSLLAEGGTAMGLSSPSTNVGRDFAPPFAPKHAFAATFLARMISNGPGSCRSRISRMSRRGSIWCRSLGGIDEGSARTRDGAAATPCRECESPTGSRRAAVGFAFGSMFVQSARREVPVADLQNTAPPHDSYFVFPTMTNQQDSRTKSMTKPCLTDSSPFWAFSHSDRTRGYNTVTSSWTEDP